MPVTTSDQPCKRAALSLDKSVVTVHLLLHPFVTVLGLRTNCRTTTARPPRDHRATGPARCSQPAGTTMGKKDKGEDMSDMEIVDNPLEAAEKGVSKTANAKANTKKKTRKQKNTEFAVKWKAMDPKEQAMLQIPIVIAKDDIVQGADYGVNANIYPFFGCTFWCMAFFPLLMKDVLCLNPNEDMDGEEDDASNSCLTKLCVNVADCAVPSCCCVRGMGKSAKKEAGCIESIFRKLYRLWMLFSLCGFGLPIAGCFFCLPYWALGAYPVQFFISLIPCTGRGARQCRWARKHSKTKCFGCKAGEPDDDDKIGMAIYKAVNSDRVYIMQKTPKQASITNAMANTCLYQKNHHFLGSLCCANSMNEFDCCEKLFALPTIFFFLMVTMMAPALLCDMGLYMIFSPAFTGSTTCYPGPDVTSDPWDMYEVFVAIPLGFIPIKVSWAGISAPYINPDFFIQFLNLGFLRVLSSIAKGSNGGMKLMCSGIASMVLIPIVCGALHAALSSDNTMCFGEGFTDCRDVDMDVLQNCPHCQGYRDGRVAYRFFPLERKLLDADASTYYGCDAEAGRWGRGCSDQYTAKNIESAKSAQSLLPVPERLTKFTGGACGSGLHSDLTSSYEVVACRQVGETSPVMIVPLVFLIFFITAGLDFTCGLCCMYRQTTKDFGGLLPPSFVLEKQIVENSGVKPIAGIVDWQTIENNYVSNGFKYKQGKASDIIQDEGTE